MTGAISNARARGHLLPDPIPKCTGASPSSGVSSAGPSEGLEVKASRGLADVWRAQPHGAEQAPAAINERKRIVEEVPVWRP